MQGETTYFKQLGDNLQARLQLDRELGFAGLANNRDVAHIYANASKYGADVSAGASRYSADQAYSLGVKNLPPKWASTLGGILGTGIGATLGVYGAIKGSKSVSSFNKYKTPY